MITNYAEISADDAQSTYGITDADSTPDAIDTNDAGGTPDSDSDNHIDDDGSDTDGDGITDEDDHDPAQVPVQQVFDLALKKTIDTTANPGPYTPGSEVTFTIQIFNQ